MILTELEEDTFVHIFSFLTPENLLHVSHCCKELYQICSQDYFWKQYCLDYQEKPKDVTSYKDFFFRYIYLKKGYIKGKPGQKTINVTIGVMGLEKSGRDCLIRKFLDPKFKLEDNVMAPHHYSLYFSNINCLISVIADVMSAKNVNFYERDALIICLDMSDPNTKKHKNYPNLIEEAQAPKRKCFIVGTKCDQVLDESIEFPKEFENFHKYKCSAMDGKNISKLFNSIINDIALEKLKNKDYKVIDQSLDEVPEFEEKKQKCILQ